MKKTSVVISSALLIGLLAGCGDNNSNSASNNAAPSASADASQNAANSSNASASVDQGQYKDGTYYAIGEPDTETGWQYYVLLNVSGGKITDVNWNGINKDIGPDKVTYSKEGKYGMKAGGASSEWHEQAEKADQFLIEKQDPKAITVKDDGTTDAISGVSIHVGDLVNLAEKALSAGPIQMGPYKDGTYHAEGDSFDPETGWKETTDLVIAGGNIIHANFSGVNEKGEDKKAYSIAGKYGMKAGGAAAEWHEEAEKAEAFLVEKQDPAAVTFKDDGTTDAISGASIHLKDYFDMAAKLLEQAK
ncbi:FMN-binding protein [Paenibacillus yonginensis]|uniref:FMN-binding protein n=2 Tax=Paenibacillus yonginensis TaxID=1462996 RepID=A0A1B1N7G5_9BACL|nr:FMN-binding protein [Paenibacillus yonginensis]ANS77373.1 FMN-binding protein [Paenibacillus yonginensis]